MDNILKTEFTYFKKTNKVSISAILNKASFQEDSFILERTRFDSKILDNIIIKDVFEKCVFTLFTKTEDFQVAEDKIKLAAFEYFNEKGNQTAMKKISNYIKLME